MFEESNIEREIELISDKIFEDIFKSNYSAMCRSVYRLIKDKDIAEDIVQEVFFNFWNNKSNYKIQSSIKSYLFRSAINGALTYLRKNKIWDITDISETTESLKNMDSQTLETSELEVIIEKSIQSLPLACRSMFILSRYEEMSYKEIAETTNTSIKTVENQIGKALKILRNHLKDYF